MIRTAVAIAALVCFAAPAFAGTYSCGGGARLLNGNRCSDGSIPIYHADTVRPYVAGSAASQSAHAVQPYRGNGSIHVFTQEERARMNRNDERAAHEIAKQWTRNGRNLNGAQLRAIENQRCLMMAAGNPDIRCVPR